MYLLENNLLTKAIETNCLEMVLTRTGNDCKWVSGGSRGTSSLLLLLASETSSLKTDDQWLEFSNAKL